ncbi:hypothetical protein H0H81_004228 [Sphagnurus paluster]|uniref:BTB domain-containing protein n=1 Tax=Sphagnurus paluster TaxID=117069 RepID=A0A9P7FS37_9AGAR|nr:hypothetical protein H0H81_004228 [Sphagnurus paluster]
MSTTKYSNKFYASDADVSFLSSDKVVFQLHRKYLEATCGAFPSAEFETRGEQVPLTEDAETLEVLFQFVYPRRHPDLKSTPFELLSRVAEAAEKYEVFAAMNVCKYRMECVHLDLISQCSPTLIFHGGNYRIMSPQHHKEVFIYAMKHGHKDIMANTAPPLLDVPLDEMAKILTPHHIVPWASGFR